jgi:hypothetical protein
MPSVDLLEQPATTLTCFSVRMAATTKHEIIVGDTPDGERSCYAWTL